MIYCLMIPSANMVIRIFKPGWELDMGPAFRHGPNMVALQLCFITSLHVALTTRLLSDTRSYALPSATSAAVRIVHPTVTRSSEFVDMTFFPRAPPCLGILTLHIQVVPECHLLTEPSYKTHASCSR